jgi:hypothetical protein
MKQSTRRVKSCRLATFAVVQLSSSILLRALE